MPGAPLYGLVWYSLLMFLFLYIAIKKMITYQKTRSKKDIIISLLSSLIFLGMILSLLC